MWNFLWSVSWTTQNLKFYINSVPQKLKFFYEISTFISTQYRKTRNFSMESVPEQPKTWKFLSIVKLNNAQLEFFIDCVPIQRKTWIFFINCVPEQCKTWNVLTILYVDNFYRLWTWTMQNLKFLPIQYLNNAKLEILYYIIQ